MNDAVVIPKPGDLVRVLEVQDDDPDHCAGDTFVVGEAYLWADKGLVHVIERGMSGLAPYGTVGRFEVLQSEASTHDAVAHPTHYTSHPSGIECIEITKHHNFCVGNVIKYCWRAGLKSVADGAGELKDLKKARQYLDFEIARLEGKSK